MKVLVFGAGALGSLIGGLLSRENEVTLVGRKLHIESIRKHGLVITGKTKMVAHPEVTEKIDRVEEPDWIILATKSFDTEKAMMSLKRFHNTSAFLSLQNGLENEELISRFANRVVGGVTTHGATLVRPGRIFHAGIGWTIVGNYKNAEGDVRRIAKALTEAGIETQISRKIKRDIWRKTIINAGINPLTAITRERNGYILEDSNLSMVMESICKEAVAVANAYRMSISLDEIIQETRKTASLTAENKSSMLQDIERGSRTEIDSICGAIARLGSKKHIPTPVITTVTAIVKSLEGRKE